VNSPTPTRSTIGRRCYRCEAAGAVHGGRIIIRPPDADTCRMALGPSFPPVLAAAQAGADWAWERLYREIAGPCLGYLRARGAREPEDLLGETFLQLARNISTFSGNEAEFRSWAFLVAHHRLVDERRALARRREDPLPDLEEHGGVGDVEAEAMARVGDARVRRLISRLTPDQQDVLLLRVVADLTVEEVARILGKRIGAVKGLQRRALAALHREIESEERVPL
jgi:RNA polymerase sigma-70 factor (ECF subfamily)